MFFGELGEESAHLIAYLERYDATPRIQPGENPATWMLTTIGAGSSASKNPFDYAGRYASSKLRDQCLERITKVCSDANEDGVVSFPTRYATGVWVQNSAVLSRAMTVYYRSPSYTMARVMVSVVVSILFATVYASQRVPETEADMNSRVNSIFIAVIFLCVNALNTVLGVFEAERNMFYRHQAANMYGSRAIIGAFTLAEIPFTFASATMFVIPFYFMMGFANDAEKFFTFYFIIILGFSMFTFIGQMLVSLLRDAQTAQVFGGLVISFTSTFAGVLVRPDAIPNFWIFMYWLLPGRYIFESLFISQFDGDETPIVASPGSPFFVALGCDVMDVCEGTADQWIKVSFQDYSKDSIPYNILYLVLVGILGTRLVTFIALTTLNYRST